MANRFEQAKNNFKEVPTSPEITDSNTTSTRLDTALNPSEQVEKTKPTQITLYPSEKEKVQILKQTLNRKSVSEVIRDLINAEYSRQFPN
ncbi:ribbon-helix-helix protein, CopG family [Enterococcus faecium]|uniref:CopG family transcriptional regulator n=2 Tax=Enterococcus TaxID=1350 RepID=A0AB37IHL0_ENTHR|nr:MULTISPECIES: ribbon-helix-helix protein, CopG family [Enterococcus]EME3493972.1 ribbon-helix-helix protein, CopG family [Enterococcus faecium]EME7174840.1 ribbon-helix-helix protein, CopG family [Enterococcus faecium]EMF0486214.1 ribbon-helix-helix protein, CopG family [Enterococcus hirae]MBG7803748.1 ribbon-helix-helix protein, CopG family [Enterococcus faecium]MBG7953242.1 ribbon-helix-helix protein, CopG family [Enterococcus faecium]